MRCDLEPGDDVQVALYTSGVQIVSRIITAASRQPRSCDDAAVPDHMQMRLCDRARRCRRGPVCIRSRVLARWRRDDCVLVGLSRRAYCEQAKIMLRVLEHFLVEEFMIEPDVSREFSSRCSTVS